MKKEFHGEDAMLEMAQDTINWFWGRPDRVNRDMAVCRYQPFGGEQQGCAIGRYLDEETAKNCDGRTSTYVKFVRHLLPDWMQKIDVDFLACLQFLHDQDAFADKSKEKAISNLERHIDVTKLTFPNENNELAI